MIECINQPDLIKGCLHAHLCSKRSMLSASRLAFSILPPILTQRVSDPPIPPPGALAVVEALNTAHKEACESYEEKEKNATARFLETRRKVLDIYQSWTVNPNEKVRVSPCSQCPLHKNI